MPVKSVECQLAEMQIGRFVSGDSLSAEAVRQLDSHLADCPHCSQVLNDRRQALRSMLNQGYAAVTTDFPSAKKENLLIKALVEKATTTTPNSPRRASVEASPEKAPTKPKWNPTSILSPAAPTKDDSKKASVSKSILYAAALGVVLFAMGYISHGQSTVFGDSADRMYPSPDSATSGQNEPSRETSANLSTVAAAARKPAKRNLIAAQKHKSSSKPNLAPLKLNPTNDSSENGIDHNTSKDASGPRKTLAKAEVHHPRKYVPAAHKRHIPVRHVRLPVEPRHRAHKPAVHRLPGVHIYDESGNRLKD